MQEEMVVAAGDVSKRADCSGGCLAASVDVSSVVSGATLWLVDGSACGALAIESRQGNAIGLEVLVVARLVEMEDLVCHALLRS
jgi:hypothetical protein